MSASCHLLDGVQDNSPLVALSRPPGEAYVVVCQPEEVDLWLAMPAMLQQLGPLSEACGLLRHDFGKEERKVYAGKRGLWEALDRPMVPSS